MTAQRGKLQVDELEAPDAPIEFLTENGFSIVRAWEVDGAQTPTSASYSFLVHKEQESPREVTVTIDEELVADISFRTRGRVTPANSFWISCAERHLAADLWEKDGYPEGNRLTVNQLDPDEIISALHWKS